MRLLLEHALLETGVESGVLLEIEGGLIKTVTVLGQSMTFSGEASAENVRIPRLAGESCTRYRDGRDPD